MPETELITKVTQDIERSDGTQARIVATQMFGYGMAASIDVFVLRRPSEEENWSLCSNRPHSDWQQMSVDEYVQGGRSEMLQTVSPGEILKVVSLIGKPLAVLRPNGASPDAEFNKS